MKCEVCKSEEHRTSGHVAGPSDIGRPGSGIWKEKQRAKSEALKNKKKKTLDLTGDSDY
jgi:hypothetical protein